MARTPKPPQWSGGGSDDFTYLRTHEGHIIYSPSMGHATCDDLDNAVTFDDIFTHADDTLGAD